MIGKQFNKLRYRNPIKMVLITDQALPINI